jgi:hypothetical protein
MVVDCGGATIDFSSYAQNGDSFEEIAPAQCKSIVDNGALLLLTRIPGLYAGSLFVTSRARIFFKGKHISYPEEFNMLSVPYVILELLQNTRFEEDVELITDRFDKKTKLDFRSQEDDYWIQIAGMREKDPELGIRAGQLKVKG